MGAGAAVPQPDPPPQKVDQPRLLHRPVSADLRLRPVYAVPAGVAGGSAPDRRPRLEPGGAVSCHGCRHDADRVHRGSCLPEISESPAVGLFKPLGQYSGDHLPAVLLLLGGAWRGVLFSGASLYPECAGVVVQQSWRFPSSLVCSSACSSSTWCIPARSLSS